MMCENCLREIDEDNEDVWECPICGKYVCDDCVTTDGLCNECDERARRQFDIFSPY